MSALIISMVWSPVSLHDAALFSLQLSFGDRSEGSSRDERSSKEMRGVGSGAQPHDQRRNQGIYCTPHT